MTAEPLRRLPEELHTKPESNTVDTLGIDWNNISSDFIAKLDEEKDPDKREENEFLGNEQPTFITRFHDLINKSHSIIDYSKTPPAPRPLAIEPDEHMVSVLALEEETTGMINRIEELLKPRVPVGERSFNKLVDILNIDNEITSLTTGIKDEDEYGNLIMDSAEIADRKQAIEEYKADKADILNDPQIKGPYEAYYDLLKVYGQLMALRSNLEIAKLTPEEHDMARAIMALTQSKDETRQKMPTPFELRDALYDVIFNTQQATKEDFTWGFYKIYQGNTESKIENILDLWIKLRRMTRKHKTNPRWVGLDRYLEIVPHMFKVNHMLSKTRLWKNNILKAGGTMDQLIAAMKEYSTYTKDGSYIEILNAFLTFDDGDPVAGYERFRALAMMYEANGLIVILAKDRTTDFIGQFNANAQNEIDFAAELLRPSANDEERVLFMKAKELRKEDSRLALMTQKDIMFLLKNYSQIYPKEKVSERGEKISRATMALLAARGPMKNDGVQSATELQREYVISPDLDVTIKDGNIAFMWQGDDVTPGSHFVPQVYDHTIGDYVARRDMHEVLQEMFYAGRIVEEGMYDFSYATMTAAQDQPDYIFAFPPMKYAIVYRELWKYINRYFSANYPAHLTQAEALRFPFILSSAFEQTRVAHPRTGAIISLAEALLIPDLTQEEAAAIRGNLMQEEDTRRADDLERAKALYDIIDDHYGIFTKEYTLSKMLVSSSDVSTTDKQPVSTNNLILDLTKFHTLHDRWRTVRKALLYVYQSWSLEEIYRKFKFQNLSGNPPDSLLAELKHDIDNPPADKEASEKMKLHWEKEAMEVDWESMIAISVFKEWSHKKAVIRSEIANSTNEGKPLNFKTMPVGEAVRRILQTFYPDFKSSSEGGNVNDQGVKNKVRDPKDKEFKFMYDMLKDFVGLTQAMIHPDIETNAEDDQYKGYKINSKTREYFAKIDPSVESWVNVDEKTVLHRHLDEDPICRAIIDGIIMILRDDTVAKKPQPTNVDRMKKRRNDKFRLSRVKKD